jgi:adenosylcobinamide-phosphate synthase
MMLHDGAVLAVALLFAMAIDIAFGEPQSRWHPVVWMGHYLNWSAERFAPFSPIESEKLRIFWLGAFYWLAGAAMVLAAAVTVQVMALSLPSLFAVLLIGFVLKPMLAYKMLVGEVLAVEKCLYESLESGRYRLALMVSRSTADLSESEIRESAIESLAENLNDSVIAPIFWFVLLGLPGAALYRFANTADAMWGYPGMREGRYWQWAGKWAARADDVLSWLPARLSALLIWLVVGARPHLLGKLRQQACLTPSPNSGWPMAAMALVLNIRLGKPGVYVLNEDGDVPSNSSVRKATTVAANAVWLTVIVASVALWIFHV